MVVGGCGSYIVDMNIALRRPFTVEEYLAWAATQRDLPRMELINGQIVAMTPERVEHIEIKVAAVIALKRAIARTGIPCHALGDGMTVRIDNHAAYEPDALVYCGERLKRGTMLARDPVVICRSAVTNDVAHRHQRQADRLFQAAQRSRLPDH
jgi:Uma2 family endonuclease